MFLWGAVSRSPVNFSIVLARMAGLKRSFPDMRMLGTSVRGSYAFAPGGGAVTQHYSAPGDSQRWFQDKKQATFGMIWL
jgi:hypothetical protein